MTAGVLPRPEADVAPPRAASVARQRLRACEAALAAGDVPLAQRLLVQALADMAAPDASAGPESRGRQPVSASWRELLFRAYALGHSSRVGEHAPALLAKERWQVCVSRPSRDLTLRLARRMECLACGAPIALNGTGDHIIARSFWAAPEGAENYLPLCPPCNASKGTKNLLAWWSAKGHPPERLVPDPLLQFARVTYSYLARNTLVDMDAPPEVLAALEALEVALLPTAEHVTVLREATHAQAAAARKGAAPFNQFTDAPPADRPRTGE